jgi:hypothetical protein
MFRGSRRGTEPSIECEITWLGIIREKIMVPQTEKEPSPPIFLEAEGLLLFYNSAPLVSVVTQINSVLNLSFFP